MAQRKCNICSKSQGILVGCMNVRQESGFDFPREPHSCRRKKEKSFKKCLRKRDLEKGNY